MEKSCDLYEFYLHAFERVQTKNCHYRMKLLKANRYSLKTVCENSTNKKRNISVKLTKTCANQKYRSKYLKRYVYKKGRTYEPWLVHVRRRADNPYDVKSVVKSLKRDQLMKITTPKHSFCTDNINYCSNLERGFVKSKNWESIRYKNQLDYKERIKMEKETSFHAYSDKRKIVRKQQPKATNYNIIPFYQNTLAARKHIPDVPRSMAGMPNEVTQRLSSKPNSLRYKNVENQNMVDSNETDRPNPPTVTVQHFQHPAVPGETNHPKLNDQKLIYYNVGDDGTDDDLQVLDYENKLVSPHQYQATIQMRHPQIQDINSHRQTSYQMDDVVQHRNQPQVPEGNETLVDKLNESETNLSSLNQTQFSRNTHEDSSYDFSIPFNESNIFIKVMSPDGKLQRHVDKQAILKDKMEKKLKLADLKKIRYDREQKIGSHVTQSDSGDGQWTEYIRTIIAKNQNQMPEDTRTECIRNITANKPISEDTRSEYIRKNTTENSNSIPIETRTEYIRNITEKKSIPEDTRTEYLRNIIGENQNMVPEDTRTQYIPNITAKKPIPQDTRTEYIRNITEKKSIPEDTRTEYLRNIIGENQNMVPEDTRTQYIPNITAKKPIPQDTRTEYIRNFPAKNSSVMPKARLDDTNKEIYATNSRGMTHLFKTMHPSSLPSNSVNNRRYYDERYIANEKESSQPSVIPMESAAPLVPPPTKYYGSSSNVQMKPMRLPIAGTRIIRPKVWHPSRYFHSDVLRHNFQYSSDDTIGVTVRAPPYPFIPPISEGHTMPQHADYVYNNQPTTYHPDFNMYSNRRLAPDNRRPQVLTPNEQAFLQYQKEFEHIPDPYGRGGMHIPLDLHLDYTQSRPTVNPRPIVDPRLYPYLNEPSMHPMWFYQHMSERQ